MDEASNERSQAGRDSEVLMVRGIVLMVLIKGVMVGWIGLDIDAWYVWPWTWVAFGMMVPAFVEWVNECRAEWDG